ncbi:uncharacterized protein MYCFIDRAFT_85020 [Pseudocercospora fijiensis CIRAD86]|uniref:Arrestin-like N-terminal domain-containing protein n=1 Tax=Pseudocercospora fijiensis (strain CIRAD86) TaxID=383855 RepID=N1Q7E2_PSEFD|nr:uncharacterized protein MYCFIDRAFT_85020 [Pseudocercospora fijiensis CIRAD86]EME88575.1 hypothetical protein MYCFIDRAFT_85020 [Pseudocercospora fijiensis CIRAD86]
MALHNYGNSAARGPPDFALPYQTTVADKVAKLGKNCNQSHRLKYHSPCTWRNLKFTLQKPNGQSALDLLPSVDSKHAKGHWSDPFKSDAIGEYQITYTVIASALQDKNVIASTPSRFNYIPAKPELEPILPDDYPGEYLVRTSKIQQNGNSTTRLGVISQEPAALSIEDCTSTLNTNINLVFMLVGRHERGHRPAPFPKKYDVVAQLKSTTFVMPRRARPELHTVQALPHSKAILKQSLSNSQRYTAAFRQWDVHDSESEDDKRSRFEEVLTNTITIPFSVHVDQALSPDFWSPLLSRRYTIELTVTLDEDSSSTTKLKLPVQIYRPPGVSD